MKTTMKTIKTTKTLLTLSAFSLMASVAYGANIFWIGDTDGTWEDSGNWSTTTGGSGGADPNNNQVFIEGATNPDVTLSSVDTVTRVLIDQGRTLYIASGGTLTGASSIAVIGDNSLGNLVVQDGGTYNRAGTLDTRFGASSVTVEDGGTVDLGTWSAKGSGGFNISGSTADVTIGNITTTGSGVDNATLTLNSASLTVTGNMTWDGADSSALSIGAGSTLNLTGAAASHTLTDGIEITGGGQVNLSGTLDANANTINITGANSTFQLGTGGTGGAINTSSAITIGSGGTFVINQSDAVTQGTEFGNSISGAGSIEQAGTGTTTLNVANSHTGGTTLSSGTLVLGDAAAAGTGTLTLAGGTLQSSILIHTNDISVTDSTTTNVEVFQSQYNGAFTGSGTINFIGSSAAGGDQSSTLGDWSGFSGTLAHDNTSANRFNIWNVADTSNVKLFTKGATTTTGLRILGTGNGTFAELSGTGGRIILRGKTLTVNQSSDTTYSGTLSNDGGSIGTFVKDGVGSLTLDGANTYTGTTTVNAGTLSLASGSSHSGSGAYAVNGGILEIASGVDLSGHAMTISLGGVISPGNSPGTASTGSQTWSDGGAYLWEINDMAGGEGVDSGWDWLDIQGTLTINPTFDILITSLTNPGNVSGLADGFDYTGLSYLDPYTSFTIATATGGVTGFDASAFNLNDSSFLNPKVGWSIENIGNDIVLNAFFVPEPSSTALLGLGGLALMLRRKRS